MILNRQKIQRMFTGSTTIIAGGGSGSSGGSGSGGGSSSGGSGGGGYSDYATNAGHADTADNATHSTTADIADGAKSLTTTSEDWLKIARKDIPQTIAQVWTFVKGIVTNSLKVMDFYQPLTLVWSYKKCWEFLPGGGHKVLIYYHTVCNDQWFLDYQAAYETDTGETISVGDIIEYNAAYDPNDKFFTEGRFGVSTTGTVDNFLAYTGETSIIEAVNSLQGSDIVALFDEVAIPQAASCGGKHIVIKNRGTASTGHTAVLDVYARKNVNVQNQFFDYIVNYPTGSTGHLSDHISINPGETVEIFSDGTYWVKIK